MLRKIIGKNPVFPSEASTGCVEIKRSSVFTIVIESKCHA